MAHRIVDISKLSSYQPPGVFTRIDPGVEKQLPKSSEVWERICGCVEFCYMVGTGGQLLDSDVEPNIRRKFLRAALSEFASLDDASAIDKSNGIFSISPRILDLEDPRLHVVRLLRHANVHLSSSNVEHTSRPAAWDGPHGQVKFEYRVNYANDVRTSITCTDQASKYNSNDLNRMISWLESEQMNWGINHLILRTAELYARVLLGPAV